MPNKRERRSTPISLAPLIGLTILAAGLAFAQQNLPASTPAPVESAATATADGAEADGDDKGDAEEIPDLGDDDVDIGEDAEDTFLEEEEEDEDEGEDGEKLEEYIQPNGGGFFFILPGVQEGKKKKKKLFL